MIEIELLGASKLTSPNPLCLICTRAQSGLTNLGTVSWWTYLGVEPPTLGFAMMKPSYSGEMTRLHKEAILVIPAEPMAKQVMACGNCSGRDTNKVERFKIDMIPFPGSEIEIPEHCVAAMHLSLRNFTDVGDHYFYICDVTKILANENEKALFAWQGYARIATAIMGQAE